MLASKRGSFFNLGRFLHVFSIKNRVMTDDYRSVIGTNLTKVLNTIAAACQQAHRTEQPRLVAVSKLKSVAEIQAAYDHGQRCFGENYVQELVDKAFQLPKDIEWHFIGHLQSNKCKLLLESIGQVTIETLDSIKLADAINKYARCVVPVFVQVNTSREVTKHGIHPDDVPCVVDHIRSSCPMLRFRGLMTIGESSEAERDFATLIECRRRLDLSECELSMGMSQDYPLATMMNSTNVRVGSAIFGNR